MARLYSNENFPLPVVDELRRRGHDVLTVRETGKAGEGWPDDEVFAFAVAQGRGVLTLNRRHFVRLHAAHPNHAGIIVCTFDQDFFAQAARIHGEIEKCGELSGKLIRINRPAKSGS
jgi:predicted nuclease of predicted toxin-antitoxin system